MVLSSAINPRYGGEAQKERCFTSNTCPQASDWAPAFLVRDETGRQGELIGQLFLRVAHVSACRLDVLASLGTTATWPWPSLRAALLKALRIPAGVVLGTLRLSDSA